MINPSNAEDTLVQSRRTQENPEKTFKPCHVGVHLIAFVEYPEKPFKPCHVGVHLIAFAEYSEKTFKPSHVGVHLIAFTEYPYARISVIFQGLLHHYVLAKLATGSIRVNKLLWERTI